MTSLLHIRIDLSLPGASISHIAELLPINATECKVRRIVELDSQGKVTGAGTTTMTVGMQAPSLDIVPHPDLYVNYPDIVASPLTESEFAALWSTALKAFPQLNKADTYPNH